MRGAHPPHSYVKSELARNHPVMSDAGAYRPGANVKSDAEAYAKSDARAYRQMPHRVFDGLGVVLGSFWDDLGVALGLCGDHFGIVLGWFGDHFGIVVVWFWDLAWDRLLGSEAESLGDVPQASHLGHKVVFC